MESGKLSLRELHIKRGRVKAQVTWFAEFLLDFETRNKSISELQTRLEKIEECFNQFDNFQSQLEALCETDEDLNKQLREREVFENSYFNHVSLARKIIAADNEKSNQNRLNEMNINTSSNLQFQASSSLNVSRKLPILDLPKFYGDYVEWSSFIDTFRAMVDRDNSIEKVTKFYYLLSCLKGDAAKVLQSLEVTDQNYEVALDLLKSRYENPSVLTKSHIKAIFNLPGIIKENDCYHLRKLLDDLQKHLRALKTLGEPIESWDTPIIYLISTKLDEISRNEWEKISIQKGKPELTDLTDFLKNRCQLLEAIQCSNQKRDHQKVQYIKRRDDKTFTHVSTQQAGCKICRGDHFIQTCEKFLQLSVEDRVKEIKKHRICLNCLRGNHMADQCRSAVNCRKCNKRHNTLIHPERTRINTNHEAIANTHTNTNIQTHNTESNSFNPSTSISAHATNKNHSKVLLATAEVLIRDESNNVRKVKALLDGASQANFISQSLYESLHLPCVKINKPVVGVGNSSTKISKKTNAKIKSLNSAFNVDLTFLIIDKITDDLPNFEVDLNLLNIPSNITLADPSFHQPGEVQLLLGAGIFYDMLLPGKITLGKEMPVCQNSVFGWVLGGNIQTFKHIDDTVSCNLSVTQSNKLLQDQLERFWITEACSYSKPLTGEEEECEMSFRETTVRNNETGQFIVKLPIRETSNQLGNSFESAKNQFLSLERKLMKNPELRKYYVDFMTEYETLGHMTTINESDLNTESVNSPNIYYCPHHAVVNENSTTTKVRVVFNASAKSTSGVSLNDKLKVGPTIQDDLFTVLIRFRKYNFVLGADIMKMYRQVLVDENQRDLQRILWRAEPNLELKHYRLNTVTYGTAPASFLAIRSLNEVAYQNFDEYPEACDAILTNFYVDDFLGGTDTIQSAIKLKEDLTSILKNYGFILRKWVANNQAILNKLDHENHGDHEIKQDDQARKTLGLLWQSKSDKLKYVANNSGAKHVTKRIVLSLIFQIFDPLGLIGPTIIKLKILLQRIWQAKIDWDDQLPLELLNTWNSIYQQLVHLNEIEIPRHVICVNAVSVEIHGFSDSSEAAYGACLYMRSVNNKGEITVRLLCAKSRVAPIKSISLPRLELCGAQLLAQLYRKVTDSIQLKIDSVYLWTDSTIVLSWLSAQPCSWRVFVANRVAEIQSLTEECKWKHVPSGENPADIISRGLDPKQLKDCELWFFGPKFLQFNPESWPVDYVPKINVNIPEQKSNNLVNLNISPSPDTDIFKRYSNLHKLQIVVALCLRFKKNLTTHKGRKITGVVCSEELEEALFVLVREAQKLDFAKEIKSLQKHGTVESNSSLKSLCPFLDKRGLIRVGGKIAKAAVPYDKKFPIVLSKNHTLTKMIIRQEHYKQLHAGSQAILYSVRQRFWPLSGKQAVRSVLKDCIVCFRAKPADIVRVMGELPQSRVTAHRPFYVTGVDLAGPFNLKDGKLRNRAIVKAYMCIFVCFTTRCVHIELVGDLSTEAFLNSLKRFVSRRGLCGHIYSDNATNFVGAKNELSKFAESLTESNTITKFCQENHISWNFIPPRSPHHGGIWEAAVRSAKHHIRRIIGNVNLTYEELSTVFTQVEAVMNSRPITPLSNDPSDLSALTPGHFLIGDYLKAIPQADVKDIPANRLKQYQFLQKLIQHFWNRWAKDYLISLQTRSKWYASSPTKIEVGSLVVLKDENTAPQHWRLGRIQELYPGRDGQVRVVLVKTVSGLVKRAVQKICVLPIDTEVESNIS